MSDIDDVDDVDWENTRENHLQMGWIVMDFPANRDLYQNHIISCRVIIQYGFGLL